MANIKYPRETTYNILVALVLLSPEAPAFSYQQEQQSTRASSISNFDINKILIDTRNIDHNSSCLSIMSFYDALIPKIFERYQDEDTNKLVMPQRFIITAAMTRFQNRLVAITSSNSTQEIMYQVQKNHKLLDLVLTSQQTKDNSSPLYYKPLLQFRDKCLDAGKSLAPYESQGGPGQAVYLSCLNAKSHGDNCLYNLNEALKYKGHPPFPAF